MGDGNDIAHEIADSVLVRLFEATEFVKNPGVRLADDILQILRLHDLASCLQPVPLNDGRSYDAFDQGKGMVDEQVGEQVLDFRFLAGS
jgi:hypothetical protein